MNLENAYALLIGVGADLPVTIKDASAIKSVLVNPKKAAYKEENVVLLTEKNASRENVLKELNSLVEKVAKKDDSTVIIYYSGHGGQYQNEGSEEYFLLTHGYDSRNRNETMVRGDEFSNIIDKIKARKLLVMLDCCHASGMIGQPLLKVKSGDDKIVNSNIELLKKLNTGEGKVFITSCDDDEQSVILPESENSLFTEVVLDALEGKASRGEEFVRVIDLLHHVLTQVPMRIKKFNHVQRPIINKIEFLSPDYFLCRAGDLEEERTIKSLKSANDLESLKKLISNYNVSNSHHRIDISTIQESQDSDEATKEKCDEQVKTIEKFLINGETQKAVSEFLKLAENCYPDQRNNVILLAGRYNGLYRDKSIGIISDGAYRIQLAQVNNALTFFLDKCK